MYLLKEFHATEDELQRQFYLHKLPESFCFKDSFEEEAQIIWDEFGAQIFIKLDGERLYGLSFV